MIGMIFATWWWLMQPIVTMIGIWQLVGGPVYRRLDPDA